MNAECDKKTNDHGPWHVRKEITAGHILITISLIGGAIASWVTMNSNIAQAHQEAEKNAMEIEHVKELNRLQGTRFESAIGRVEAQFEKIDNKLEAIRKEMGK